MLYESRIAGANLLWISVFFTAAFLFVCWTGGSIVNWGYLGFEVLFPLYTAVVTAEWCRTRTDPVFEVVCAQGTSLFGWIGRRFALLFGTVAVFAFAGMIGVVAGRKEGSVFDLLLTYLPTAFFLSSFSVLVSLLAGRPHIAAMAAGVVWLLSMMCMSLLRFTPVQYFYLFARYAGIDSPVWMINKVLLLSLGTVFWLQAALLCRRRAWE